VGYNFPTHVNVFTVVQQHFQQKGKNWVDRAQCTKTSLPAHHSLHLHAANHIHCPLAVDMHIVDSSGGYTHCGIPPDEATQTNVFMQTCAIQQYHLPEDV
jgi:hypothetical protein